MHRFLRARDRANITPIRRRMTLDDLLKRNRAWAARQVEADPGFFTRLVAGQQPRLLWIGCSDSRVPAEQLLDCSPGQLFIHRNVANIVAYNDINISSVIQYASSQLKVPDVVVCGHYGCGGIAAACAAQVQQGYIGDWLNIADHARREVDMRLAEAERTVPSEEFLRMVVEANVRLQVRHLRNLSVIRECWERTPGVPRLHGWVYDIGTGLIKVLDSDG
jgi:carbonic anhydrase